jgi:hypothetical protein
MIFGSIVNVVLLAFVIKTRSSLSRIIQNSLNLNSITLRFYTEFYSNRKETYRIHCSAKRKKFLFPSEISPEHHVFNIAESESEATKFLSHTIFQRNEVFIKFNITFE